MNAAAQLSLHESIAVYWLMLKSTESGDYKAAISYADALMRTVPGTAIQVVPVLAHFAADKVASEVGQDCSQEQPAMAIPVFFIASPKCDGRAHAT